MKTLHIIDLSMYVNIFVYAELRTFIMFIEQFATIEQTRHHCFFKVLEAKQKLKLATPDIHVPDLMSPSKPPSASMRDA